MIDSIKYWNSFIYAKNEELVARDQVNVSFHPTRTEKLRYYTIEICVRFIFPDSACNGHCVNLVHVCLHNTYAVDCEQLQ